MKIGQMVGIFDDIDEVQETTLMMENLSKLSNK
jgi:hypothetical protein